MSKQKYLSLAEIPSLPPGSRVNTIGIITRVEVSDTHLDLSLSDESGVPISLSATLSVPLPPDSVAALSVGSVFRVHRVLRADPSSSSDLTGKVGVKSPGSWAVFSKGQIVVSSSPHPSIEAECLERVKKLEEWSQKTQKPKTVTVVKRKEKERKDTSRAAPKLITLSDVSPLTTSFDCVAYVCLLNPFLWGFDSK